MEQVFEVLRLCEEQDRIPVYDLSYAVALLSEIGVKQKMTETTKIRDAECLEQMYQYWN